jgi:hemoglobin
MQTNQYQVQASVQRLQDRMEAFSLDFFSRLFAVVPALEPLFASEESRRLKLRAMLSTLANCRDLEKLIPAIRRLGGRHQDYGVGSEDYAPLCSVLLGSVSRIDPEGMDALVLQAWHTLLEQVCEVMAPGYEGEISVDVLPPTVAFETGSPVRDESLYEQVGGMEAVERVHQRFYQSLFADDWLGHFFATKSISSLVLKQTRFMVAAFGGPDDYRWDSPAVAHMHMYVTGEQADVREILLRNAIRLEGHDQSVEDRWLAVDQAFRPAIVKQHPDECVMRCPGQLAISAPRPPGYKPPLLVSRPAAIMAQGSATQLQY